MKRNYVIALTFVALGAALYISLHKETNKTEEKDAAILTRVSATPVERGNMTVNTTTYQASVESIQSTIIKADTSGTITQLPARLGDRVVVGQLLATVENPGSGVESSESSIRDAEIVQAEISVSQKKNIYKEARRVYDNHKTHANESAKKIAKLNYESAQVALDALLDRRTIKSPVAGVVTSLSIDKNESVSAGQDLMTIGIPNVAKIIFSVSSADLNAVSIGKKVLIETDAEDQMLNGSVVRIAPQADPATGKILIEVRPELSNGETLIPGTSIKVMVASNNEAGKQSMIIPLEALLVGQNSNSVLVLYEGDNHVKKVEVAIVKIHGGVAEIDTKDLKATDRIVTSNVHSIDEGEEVVIDSNGK